MDERSLIRDKRATLVLALILVMAGSGGATGRYCLQTGPPPLRFDTARPERKFIYPNALPAAAGPTNASACLPATEKSPPLTNAPAEGIASASPGSTNIPTGSDLFDSSSPPGSTLNSEPKGVPAGELLVVTPQMLAEYLKPISGVLARPATNAAPSGDVLFSPPTPKVAPGATAIRPPQ